MLAVATLAQDVESLFEQGAACLEAGDGQGALKYFQQAAELEPNEPGIVYNTGIAASMTGDYTLSIASFSRYRQLVPDDALGLTKLIQAYQGAGQDSEAEQQIAELRRWWKAGKLRDTYIAKERSFLRDRFRVGKYEIMAFEFVEPNHKEREHTWDFCIMEGTKQVGMIYVMLDEAANEVSGLEDGATPYYFDVRWQGGGGTLVGVTERRPTYAEAAAVVKRALSGEKVGPLIKLP